MHDSNTQQLNFITLLHKQVPVRHLVFMVHGIGQRLEKSNLVDDVGCFRQVTTSVAERHLTSHQRGTQRVLYIPCQVSTMLVSLQMLFPILVYATKNNVIIW